MKVSEQKALGARIQRKKPRESNIFKSTGKATNYKNINGICLYLQPVAFIPAHRR